MNLILQLHTDKTHIDIMPLAYKKSPSFFHPRSCNGTQKDSFCRTRKGTLKFIIGGRRFSKIRVVKLGAYDSRSALYLRSPTAPMRRTKQRRRKDPIPTEEEKPGLRSSVSRIIEGSVNQYTAPGRAERYAGRLAGFRSIMPGIRDIIKATFQFNSDILKDIIKGQPTTQRRGH